MKIDIKTLDYFYKGNLLYNIKVFTDSIMGWDLMANWKDQKEDYKEKLGKFYLKDLEVKESQKFTKDILIKKLDNLGCKDYKLRFIKRGKYGEPEAWIYPKDNPKQEMIRQRKNGLVRLCDFNGNPKMESCSGMLIEQESLDDLDFLKEYLYSYIN